jgi:hypothetical protein
LENYDGGVVIIDLMHRPMTDINNLNKIGTGHRIMRVAIHYLFIPLLFCISASAFAGGGRTDDARSIRVPNGAVNPGYAEEIPHRTNPETPGVWPGTAYWPRGYNDTSNQGTWKVYIKSWDSDPPNTVWVYVVNDSPALQKYTEGNLIVNTGWLGQTGGFWPENTAYANNLKLKQGVNRIPVNIHHVKGQIIRAKLTGVKPVSNILLFD